MKLGSTHVSVIYPIIVPQDRIDHGGVGGETEVHISWRMVEATLGGHVQIGRRSVSHITLIMDGGGEM